MRDAERSSPARRLNAEHHGFAHAKINLFLHIIGRRNDGYHILDSLAVFAHSADEITLQLLGTSGGRVELNIEGPFSNGLTVDEDNLVLKAAHALSERYENLEKLPSFRAVLKKNLPIASGIGGGSADAACALRMLMRAWGSIDAHVISEIAYALGADVPVCLDEQTTRMGGVGEILEPYAGLPSFYLTLVNPGVAVSTPQIFKAWHDQNLGFEAPADLTPKWQGLDDFIATMMRVSNTLEKPAIALCPVISEVLSALSAQKGCRLARMSGSGATCFGIFPTSIAAQNAARALQRHGWWADSGPVFDKK